MTLLQAVCGVYSSSDITSAIKIVITMAESKTPGLRSFETLHKVTL